MKRKQFKVQIDPEHENALHALGAPYNLSGNSVLAAAAAELTKVQQSGGNLWQALGRIADDAGPLHTVSAAAAPRISRSGQARALQPVT